jgi:hypothetical protein
MAAGVTMRVTMVVAMGMSVMAMGMAVMMGMSGHANLLLADG